MLLMPGVRPGSRSFDPEINLIMVGLEKAINTAAAAFIPGVCAKRSTNNPRKNDEINNNQPGVSKGSKSINKTYRYGLI